MGILYNGRCYISGCRYKFFFNLEDEAKVKMLAQADLSDVIWDNVTEEQERRLFEEKKQYDSKILELDRNQ